MPKIHESVYLAQGARVIGDVTLEEDASVWYNAVIRGDEYPIHIGKRTNIQDNAVLHVGAGNRCTIGDDVTIGHGAIVHGCEVGDGSLIGMGAIILNGAKIGRDCIIGAGALVPEKKVIPDGSVVMGVPGKVVRPITGEDKEHHRNNVRLYVKQARENRLGESDPALS